MAKINFIYRSTNDIGKLSIRFVHGKEIDYRVATPIESRKEYWFKRTTRKGKTINRHLQLKDLPNNGSSQFKNHKEELTNIQDSIIEHFISDYNKGVPITSKWLKKKVFDLTNVLDTKTKIDAISKQITEAKNKKDQEEKEIIKANLLESAIKKMFVKYKTNENELKKYKVTYNMLLKYQEAKKIKFNIKDLNQDFADEFMNWSVLDMRYSKSYTNAQLKRFRSSAVNAYENDDKDYIQVSKKLKTFKMFDKVYKDKIVITLNYNELDTIDETKLENESLFDAKKAILIGCETGLRYSDFNKLNDENIQTINGVDYWKFRTEKTDTVVQIIITERIKYLIDKYGIPQTNYPDNGVKLNEDIKEVCEEAGIKELVKGSKAEVIKVEGKKVIRNIRGEYPKCKLITSRTFRRSFATNYYGKIDTALITAITGHSTENQLRAYINNKDESNIERTKEQIDHFHNTRTKETNKPHKLKII
ncbi:hypothetical protein [Formosa sp. A9]|uniref:hypothetical protein n=1 Tax=Formosa sp. A9 TaxID=3442641 RepID=UPI003EC0BB68